MDVRAAAPWTLVAVSCFGCSSAPPPCSIEGVAYTRAAGERLGSVSSFEDAAIDSQGNTYFALDHGTDLTIEGVVHPSPTGHAALLISLDPAGAVRWWRTIAGADFSTVVDLHVTTEDSLVVSIALTGSAVDVYGTPITLPDATNLNHLVARLDSNGAGLGVEVSSDVAPSASAVDSFAVGSASTTIESGYVCGTTTHACGSTQTSPSSACRMFVCEVDSLGGFVRYSEVTASGGDVNGFELVRGYDGGLYGYRNGLRSVTPYGGPEVSAPTSQQFGSAMIVAFDDQLRVASALDLGTQEVSALTVDEGGRFIVAGNARAPLRGHAFTSCGTVADCVNPFVAELEADGTLRWVIEGRSTSSDAHLDSLIRLSSGHHVAGGHVGATSTTFGRVRVTPDADNAGQRYFLEIDQFGDIVAHALVPVRGEGSIFELPAVTDGTNIHTLGYALYQEDRSTACAGVAPPPDPSDWSLDFLTIRFVDAP